MGWLKYSNLIGSNQASEFCLSGIACIEACMYSVQRIIEP